LTRSSWQVDLMAGIGYALEKDPAEFLESVELKSEVTA
jgi:hypothetical protein